MIDNYRLITIPSAIAIIIDTAICNQVMSLTFWTIGMVTSTETATISFVENIYRATDKWKYGASLFFGMSNTFDSIDIDILSSCYWYSEKDPNVNYVEKKLCAMGKWKCSTVWY